MLRRVVFALFFCWYSCVLLGQVCDGNLGENIFEDGDFGSGDANLFPTDPGIAPGYTYTLNTPPSDGFYTLTNNTGDWTGLYQTWLVLQDNSNDTDGYMMVVNASFDPGLFYEQEVDGLCENTLYEFSADIINLIQSGVGGHIAPNVSFLIDNASQYTTGNIPQNQQWNTYGFTFTTGPGQTSVILSLRNNAPGGIGNDLAIDNISFQPCGPLAQILPDDLESICEDGDPLEIFATVTGGQYDNPTFQWQQSFDQGATWEDIPGANGMSFFHSEVASGFYYYRYLLANSLDNLDNSKCRVVSNIKIVEVVPKFWNIIDTLCEGLTYFQGDNTYEQTGIYVDSLISSIGCDSIVTLDLTFIPDLGLQADISTTSPICFGETGGSIMIENITETYPPYNFVIDGSFNTDLPLITNLLAGAYEVAIFDRYGCSYTTEVFIQPPEEFVIDLGPDWNIQLGEPVQIDATTNDVIVSSTWVPEVPDCAGDCLDFEIFPTESSFYYLSAISDDDCLAVDSVFINVEKIRKVFIPNVFTPNFDGFNDYFAPIVIAPNVQSVQNFQVFNRWGAVVYEGKNFIPDPFTGGWDGTFKGKPAEVGVYVYLADVLFLDGEVVQYSGDVMLVR